MQHFELKILSFEPGKYRMARCLCVCGTEKLVRLSHITSGKTKSCGCMRNKVVTERHGFSSTPTHSVWSYLVKSGRVDDAHPWRHFGRFLADMTLPTEPSRLAQLDGSASYSKENCVWVPMTVSKSDFLATYPKTNRKTFGLPIVYGTESKSLAEWARYFSLTYSQIYYRLYVGKDAKLSATEVIALIHKELNV